MAKEKIHIDKDSTVIIRITDGCVSDYYLPDGLELVIIDDDAIEHGEETDEITDAAILFLEQQDE